MEKLLDAFFGRFESRRFVVLDEILREEIAKPVDISSTDQVVQAPHRGGMIHRASVCRLTATIVCTSVLGHVSGENDARLRERSGTTPD